MRSVKTLGDTVCMDELLMKFSQKKHKQQNSLMSKVEV